MRALSQITAPTPWLRWAGAITFGVALLSESVVVAQTGTEVAAARRLFREGVDAAREQRWQEARDAFKGSFDLAPRPNTLLNLARAYEHTSQLVEAAESYRRVIGGADQEPVDARHLQAARDSLQRVEPRLAKARLIIDGNTDGAQLQLDGSSVPWAVAAVDMELNPGSHAFVVLRGNEAVESARLEVGEGEFREVELRVPPPSMLSPESVAAQGSGQWHGGGREGGQAIDGPPDDSDSGTNIGLWVGLSAGAVVVIGVVIALAVVLSGGSSDAGYQGELGDPWVVP